MNAPVQNPTAVHTTCPYCGVGCGVVATPEPAGTVHIAGDAAHPANFGRLCSKGAALGETVGYGTRLLEPMMRIGSDALAPVSWDHALDHVAQGLRDTLERHGPQAIAFYLSGQLLTEDYYAANKLAKGFLGTANVDTNSRLCMASSVAGHKRAFGSDTVPGSYEDLDEADLIILTGSNTAWCHPVLFRRMVAARQRRGTKLVVIDPRRTATGEEADLFLPIAHGTDTALFSGLLVHLAELGALDESYIADHTSGFATALEQARRIAPSLAATASATGLPEADVARFFALFATTERTVTCYSQGVNQSAQGTDKVNAILNCHLATGRIGRPGMGPFSLTGQPNAMGGREVGGLANQLAAHMGFSPEEVDRVRRFWDAPAMAQKEGLKAVDMFAAIGRGEIRALWVMGTNPAVSLPRAGAVRSALANLDLFVVSDNVRHTDTIASGAHVLLPAAAWGEKDGTVTNSERRISRQRPFLPRPASVKPDWWAIAEVAKRLGRGGAFAWRGPGDIFREHATLSGFENGGSRDFDISGLADLSDAAYEALAPVQWPVRPGAQRGRPRLFGDGGFFTPDRKARFVSPALPRAATPTADFPLLLNTGRIRDQWHTMTRTGLSPRLARHIPAPFVAVNPRDAAHVGLEDGGLARLTTAHGTVRLQVRVDDGQSPGTVFAPIHWSGANCSDGRVGPLVQDDTDPFSGQPDMKATPVGLTPLPSPQEAFILSRTSLDLPPGSFWSRGALAGGYGWKVLADLDINVWKAFGRPLLAGREYAELEDRAGGHYRLAAFEPDGSLALVLMAGPRGSVPGWDILIRLFEHGPVGDADRKVILSGRHGDGAEAGGPLVCACFGVGAGPICAAIAGGATTPEAVGTRLKAGTNCGSCLPEIRRLIGEAAAPADTMLAPVA
ncbi:nitrate reductase [Aquabacter sediminis]|uniref:nitrate reductase n=1 Tax=Aquabacter sediminis TaxID=3029197 RepID=UPI00237EC7ED|nr:nitrate reductase [Aquabacter sp. P-9]MDE1568531.1 molybdopterin-dependent oxidoreductase [Aquabacter sp. P-9]